MVFSLEGTRIITKRNTSADYSIMVKSGKHKEPVSPRRKIEAEIEKLKRENLELQSILLERPQVKKGTRRFCCFFGFLLAAGLFSLLSLKTAVNNDLPSYVQPYANWLLTHPLVPRTALDLASTVLKDRVTSPGQILALSGAAKKHPVVFVPGFTSSALELWRTDHECAAHVSPRSRIYSGPAMSLLTTNIQCWLGHMSLNASTWKDRQGVKVRPSSGLSAADYFGFAMESLFLWGKIIRELGLLGYDENSMHMASFDWRLSLTDLETRDFYFSKLKSQIELLRATNDGEKVVVVAHSMGSNVFYYFMQWVSAGNGAAKPQGIGAIKHFNALFHYQCLQGGIGRAQAQSVAASWVEENIQSVVLVGNSLMGSPKVLNSMLTGNVREVLSLWAPARSILENVLTRFDFAAIFRSWGSMGLLMPVGGEAIWGNATWSPEGKDLGQMLTFTKPQDDANSVEGEITKEELKVGVLSDVKKEPSLSKGEEHGPSQCIGSTPSEERVEMLGRKKVMLEQVEACALSEDRRKHVLGHSSSCNDSVPGAALSVDAAHSLLREVAPHWGGLIDGNYDFRGPSEESHNAIKYNSPSWAAGQTPATSWANPLATPLPYAPSLTMYCLHGVGVPTDRAFVLKAASDYNKHADVENEEGLAGEAPQQPEIVGLEQTLNRKKFEAGESFASSLPSPPTWGSTEFEEQNGLPFIVDDTAHDIASGVENGIRTVDGDGTITAFALGLPCGHLWKDQRYNPGSAASVLREYPHLSIDSIDGPSKTPIGDPLLELHQMEKKLFSSATAVTCEGLFDSNNEGEHGACMAVDLDGDGIVDTHVWDTDGDGVFDATDTTGDGLPEPIYAASSSKDKKKKKSASSTHKVTNETVAAAVAAAAAASNGTNVTVNPVVLGSSSYWDDVVAMLRDADLGAFGRGLGLASDHVNILGNNALVSDVLKIATGTANGGRQCEEAKRSQDARNSRATNSKWKDWFSTEDVEADDLSADQETEHEQGKVCFEGSVKDRILSKALEAAARVPL